MQWEWQPHNMADTLESELGQSAEQQAELLLTFKNGGFSSSSSSSSSTAFPQPSEPAPDFSPLSALGLQRVGEERASPAKEPSIPLNRRGMPARMRKKNRLYFDDDLVSSPTQVKSPKKTSRSTPKKQANPQPIPSSPLKVIDGIVPTPYIPEVGAPEKMEPQTITTPDKKVAQQNGVRLRNFLKLPQAHKWVYFEWFYSNIDKPLFGGENDFQIVLKEAFPQLKTRKLSRRQWGMIRRMMGKPRRCSQAFFHEECLALDKKRQVLRLLQQRKITDISTLKDFPLPDQIPMQLVIGTKVTARIRKPENGLYTGIIDAVDTSDNTYRITFDRHGIGTHSIPDFEVLSSEGAEIMPLSSFSQKFRPRPPLGMVTPPRPILPKLEPGSGTDSPALSLTNDPILAQSPLKSTKLSMDDTLGGFPVKCLVQIVQLSKILRAKREKIGSLREMNEQAEKQRSYGLEMTLDFQRKYAALVLEIEKLNRDLNHYLLAVQQFCQEIAPDQGMAGPTLLPGQIRERCYEEAATIVDVTNHSSGSPQVSSPAVLDLITKLTSLMLQIKNLAETEVSAFELTSLQETLNEIRGSLDESNKDAFQNNVEVHLTHIMSAVSQMGTLQAFNNHNNNNL